MHPDTAIDAQSSGLAPAAKNAALHTIDRRYGIGFVAGTLVGLAFGIPGGHALLRDRGSSPSTAAAAPTPSPAAERLDSRVASLVDEGRQAIRRGQPERAFAAAVEAERLDPNNPNVKNNLCAYLGELHRYDDAIAACNAALRLQPDFQLARNNLAWVQAERSKPNAPSSVAAGRER
jgi:tetratricopeptide (TPR) repeat protein